MLRGTSPPAPLGREEGSRVARAGSHTAIQAAGARTAWQAGVSGTREWRMAGVSSMRAVDGSLPGSGRAHPARGTAVEGTVCGCHAPSALHGWHHLGLALSFRPGSAAPPAGALPRLILVHDQLALSRTGSGSV